MNKTGLILQNKTFNNALCSLEKLESDREFCKHDLTHLIEVARIMLIINERENLNLDYNLIIGASLLHDLGRINGYKFNSDHHLEGQDLIKRILTECTYSKDEINKILSAISLHKSSSEDKLSNTLFMADKLSRPCYTCKMKNECYWDNSLKNKRYYKWKSETENLT